MLVVAKHSDQQKAAHGSVAPSQAVCPHLCMQVVEAQCHIQCHLPAQPLPLHGLSVVPQRRVQVSPLQDTTI